MRHTWILLLAAVTSIPAAFALECASCQKDLENLHQHLQERDRTISLLDENKRYLASLKAEEASKFLKVNSNVVVILKKLDQIKADTEHDQDRIAHDGCTECQKANAPKNKPTNFQEVARND